MRRKEENQSPGGKGNEQNHWSKDGLASTTFLLLLTVLSVNQTAAVESILELEQKWTGDFDGMVERHKIHVLIPYSKTFYFFQDGPGQAGVTYEMLKIFEKWLNEKLGKRPLKVHVVIIPAPSEHLLSGFREGDGDIAAGNLTLYPELAVRTGAELCCAFGKNSSRLRKVIKELVAGHRQKTLIFNRITDRYLKSTKWVKNALTKEDPQRFSEADGFFIR